MQLSVCRFYAVNYKSTLEELIFRRRRQSARVGAASTINDVDRSTSARSRLFVLSALDRLLCCIQSNCFVLAAFRRSSPVSAVKQPQRNCISDAAVMPIVYSVGVVSVYFGLKLQQKIFVLSFIFVLSALITLLNADRAPHKFKLHQEYDSRFVIHLRYFYKFNATS